MAKKENNTLKITVKYLSVLRERAGRSAEVFCLPDGSVLHDVTDRIAAQHGIRLPDPHVMLILNGKGFSQHPKKLQTRLKNDDTILLLPPVSGG